MGQAENHTRVGIHYQTKNMETISKQFHKGLPLGILAFIFTSLFVMGLSFVISFSGTPPYYPGPWESPQVITAYFQNQSRDVLICAFFQFAAAIPLGLFTTSIVSRLQFLGVKSSGAYIALFGGFAAAFNLAISALMLWVMAYPGIAQDASITRVLYYLVFAIGGVGYSVPLGLLIAGLSITCDFMKLLPKWMTWFGIVLALFGEISSLSLIFPELVFLIPLTRFPGFIWLIITGFMLPKHVTK